MLEPVPWLVGGGAVHSPEVARLLGFVATAGRQGVVGVADLSVGQLPSPGPAVFVNPGAYAVLNTYPSQVSQNYIGRAGSGTEVPVSNTGSTKRSDMLVIRIDDPQYGGTTPADAAVGPYARFDVITNVGSTATTVPIGLNYPALPLARIDIPASTSTITDSMVTDLRELVDPKVWYEQRAYNLTGAEAETLAVTVDKGEIFPNAAIEMVYIPEWATSVSIVATWAQIKYRGGDTKGAFWYEFGPYVETSVREYSTQRMMFDSDGGANAQRTNWVATDTVSVDKSIRGTTQRFHPKGKVSSGSGDARPYMDGVSGVSLQLFFRQLPVAEYKP